MNSIATSVLKNMRFPEASRSIASGAENGVRLANTRENFANTATSARGKKRTHGLVFENDKRNDNGRYVRYYRSPHYAVNNYAENPSTREMNRVKLARFSNASRKATFERAVADRNVAAVRRLLDERFVPSKELAITAVQALACRPNGLDVVQRLVSTHRSFGNSYDDAQVYMGIVACSKARAQDLIRLFLKAGIVPNSQPWNNDGTAALLDWAIHAGLDTALLKKLVSKDKEYKMDVIAKVLQLQTKRHATGGMPAGLQRFVASLGGVDSPLIVTIVSITPRPARIIRWLVEDAGYRATVDDVLLALHFRHLQVAVYLASRHAWSPADAKKLAVFFHDKDGNLTGNAVNNLRAKTSFLKNARAPAYMRILRDIAGLPAPPPKQRPPAYKQNDPLDRIYNYLNNGNALMYGQQNTYPPRHVRVRKPSIAGYPSNVYILQRPNARSSPPDRIASKADLDAWQRRHGILRGTTRPGRTSWNVQTQNPLVPQPTNARNHRNSRYLKANAAARRIQAAYRTATTTKKKTLPPAKAAARAPARK
jgi:hypothetical protein